jgi:hypothetical protein
MQITGLQAHNWGCIACNLHIIGLQLWTLITDIVR